MRCVLEMPIKAFEALRAIDGSRPESEPRWQGLQGFLGRGSRLIMGITGFVGGLIGVSKTFEVYLLSLPDPPSRHTKHAKAWGSQTKLLNETPQLATPLSNKHLGYRS